VQSVEVLGHQACHNIFIVLLLALLAVHIYWTLIIGQMFRRYIFVGKVCFTYHCCAALLV
jgi:hypothetical protein